MATTLISNTPPLRDVLYAFSLAKPVPDAEVLDDFVRRYPEYAAALTDFAIELVMDTLTGAVESVDKPSEAVNVVSPAVSRAMSRFQNRLYAVRRAQASDSRERSTAASVENPFAAIDRSRFRSLAQRLNVNTVFLLKLRDRQIDPSTIPESFSRRVADELPAPLDGVLAHFAAQPNVQESRQYFKADQKPEVAARQTFEEAVQSSRLTPDQQRYLLSL